MQGGTTSTAAAPTTEYERGRADAQRHQRATERNWIRPVLGPLLWLGVPMALSWFYLRRIGGGGLMGGLGSASGKGGKTNPWSEMMEQMMPIKKRQFRVDVKGTSFKDVIGIDEAKAEVRQYVDFLTQPNRFTRLGARLPRGCLLSGEPGTGKTLLAKAVAAEAQVPFFSCSGADFIELMGGSGPKRVRELFDEARRAAPAIIFIDEIDAVGSRSGARNGGGGSVSSEENRTINQLLAELDGLTTHTSPIVVMAATNLQDNMDPALLREGRFDRKVVIDMPDVRARQELFAHYLARVCTGDAGGRVSDAHGQPVPVHKDVSNTAWAHRLADRTPGLSPATIATIVNEAALQCGRAGKAVVDWPSIVSAVDDTLLGRAQRSRRGSAARRRCAVQQAGHALVAWMLPTVPEVMQVSTVARGQSPHGYTRQAGTEFHEYQTNVTLFADVAVMLGGRAAEEVLLQTASASVMSDLQRASDVALKQVLAFGMSAHVGLLAHSPEYTQAGREFTTYSDDAQHRAEGEAQRLVATAYELAVQLMREHRDKLEKLVSALMLKGELNTAELRELWGSRPEHPTKAELLTRVQSALGSFDPPARREASTDSAAAAAV